MHVFPYVDVVVVTFLHRAGVLGNTSVSPDGKDLLAPPGSSPPTPAPLTLCLTSALGNSVLTALPLDVSAASEVVVFANMVTAEEAANEEEMIDILDDTKVECEKHGKVITVYPSVSRAVY